MNGTLLEQNIFWNHTCLFLHMQFEMIFCIENTEVSNWKGFKESFIKSHSDKISYLTQKIFYANVGAMADGTRLSARPSNFDMVHLITLLLHQTGFRLNGENVLICSLSIPIRPDIWPRSAFLHEAWLSSNHFKTVKIFLRSMFRHP